MLGYISAHSVLLESAKSLSRMAVILHSHQQCISGSSFSAYSPSLYIFTIINFSHSDRYLVIACCGFSLPFLKWLMILNILFSCFFFCHLYILIVKCVFMPFVHFIIRCLSLTVLRVLSRFLDVKPPYQIYALQILPSTL